MRVSAGSRPSALAVEDGAERTLTCVVVVPLTGDGVGCEGRRRRGQAGTRGEGGRQRGRVEGQRGVGAGGCGRGRSRRRSAGGQQQEQNQGRESAHTLILLSAQESRGQREGQTGQEQAEFENGAREGEGRLQA